MTNTATANSAAGSRSWTAFVKSIASFNGDLSSLTAPPFILSSTSLTEFSQYWCQHPGLFVAPSREPDPTRRALLVLRWFLSTLKQQYASRSEQFGNEKKPLNPFLGELFLGTWEDQDEGTTQLVSEQVSHHPPATAYCITNFESGVRLQGYNAQKANFSSTIHIKQIGHAVLTVPTLNGTSDSYLFTLPSLHIEGLLFGSPFVELEGVSHMTSSTGFSARIDYSGRGWLSGKKNSVSATLYQADAEHSVLYSANGQWNGTINFTEGRGGSQLEALNSGSIPITPLTVAPVESQHPLESRRAWAKVAAAVACTDMEAIAAEKSKIERAQREARAREKADGTSWNSRFFCTKESDPVLQSLGPRIGVSSNGDAEKTGGLWRFDEAKAKAVADNPHPTAEEAEKLEQQLLGQ